MQTINRNNFIARGSLFFPASRQLLKLISTYEMIDILPNKIVRGSRMVLSWGTIISTKKNNMPIKHDITNSLIERFSLPFSIEKNLFTTFWIIINHHFWFWLRIVYFIDHQILYFMPISFLLYFPIDFANLLEYVRMLSAATPSQKIAALPNPPDKVHTSPIKEAAFAQLFIDFFCLFAFL